jgi:hypothetical protein
MNLESLEKRKEIRLDQDEIMIELLESLDLFDFNDSLQYSSLNPTRLWNDLQDRGYRVPPPLLLVERELHSPARDSAEFQLPVTVDAYQETSYQEFQNILLRMQGKTERSDEYIHFKLDFQSIWRGLPKAEKS